MLLAEIIFNYYIRFKTNIVKPIIQDPPTSHKIQANSCFYISKIIFPCKGPIMNVKSSPLRNSLSIAVGQEKPSALHFFPFQK